MYLRKELCELIRSDQGVFDFILNSTIDGLWFWDLDNPENEWMNARFWTVLGHNPDEIPHKSSAWQKIINQDDLKAANENFTKHLKNPNHPFDQVVRYTHKNGSAVWIRCRGIAIRDENGNPVRMLGVHQDISEGKRTEQELFRAKEEAEESEKGLKSIVDNLLDLVALTDLKGNYTFAGTSHKILGYENDYLIGKNVMDFVHPDDLPAVQARFADFISSKQSRADATYRNRCADGSYLWFETIGTFIMDNDGSPKEILFNTRNITDRKQAEEKLRGVETERRALLEANPDLMFLFDKEGHFIDYEASKDAELLKSPKEFLKQHITQILPPDLAQTTMDNLAKIFNDRQAQIYEYPLEISGKNRFFESRMVPCGDDRALAFVRDITGKKQKEIQEKVLFEIANATFLSENLEALLAKIKIHLNKLIDTSNFYVALFNKEKNTFSTSHQADEKDQIEKWPAGKSVTGLVVRKKKALLLKKPDILKMIKSGDIEQTGSMCEVWLGVPLISGQENVGVLALQDYHNPNAYDQGSKEILEFVSSQISMAIQRKQFIEDLKQAKEKAEDSEAKYRTLYENLKQERILLRTIVDSIPDAIYLKDSEYRKMLANKADCINCGVEKEEDLIGKTDYELFPAGIYEHFLTDDKKVIKEGIGVVNREERVLLPNGNTKWLLTSKLPLYNGKGKIVGLVGIGRDITTEKKAKQELIAAKEKAEESDRLKSAFLANMSHEIRTPMNGILGFAELLKNPRLTDEQQQQYIEIIEKGGARMLNIINDIVDISRIEAGVMEVSLAESDINELLDYTISFFKPEVEAKGMRLLLTEVLPKERAMVVTDREKVLAILTNLVKNAIKYSNEGTIEFGCNKKGSKLEFFVKDTGIGIPKDRQQAIFDRFVQADIEDKEARQGAGLGLAISKSYVEMLGGEIWVESKEGKGSTFYFTIPRDVKIEGRKKGGINASVESKDPQTKKLKILIVEDDEMSSMLLEKFLEPFAKDILQVFTGEDAVDICRQHPDIDLILMDIKLPGIDGAEATKQIREFNKDVVIVAQTAKALSGDRQSMLDTGCNDYMTKPINKEDLHETIKRLFLKS